MATKKQTAPAKKAKKKAGTDFSGGGPTNRDGSDLGGGAGNGGGKGKTKRAAAKKKK